MPDHVNRHRPLRPDELPRHYRRIRFVDTEDLARERELDPERRQEFNADFWDPWIGRYADADHDYFSNHEMLQRVAWELVFERGATVAMAVPPEKWARMEEIFGHRQGAESLPRQRARNLDVLSARLKERVTYLHSESAEDCCDLLRSDMRLVNIGQLGELISLCERAQPAELSSLQGAVALLMLLKPFWVRPLSSWQMPNQDAVTSFDSLLSHLFVEYPVPEILYGAWIAPARYELRASKWIVWFVLLGQGASLHRASRVFGWRAPDSFAAHLMSAPRNLTPFEACAWAEAHRLGGSPVEFRRIRALPAFAIDVTEPFGEWGNEFGDMADWFVEGRAFTARFLKFWRETIPWLVRHRDGMNDEDCAVILAWAAECARLAPDEAPFSWRNRTPRGCLRHAAAVAENLQYPYRNLRWKKKGWHWDWSQGPDDRWSIRELASEQALHEEGARMEHCVALYADRCFAGQSSIFSLERRGQPCLTIEVYPLHRQIAQMRGLRNRAASEEETAVVERLNAEVLSARKTPQKP